MFIDEPNLTIADHPDLLNAASSDKYIRPQLEEIVKTWRERFPHNKATDIQIGFCDYPIQDENGLKVTNKASAYFKVDTGRTKIERCEIRINSGIFNGNLRVGRVAPKFGIFQTLLHELCEMELHLQESNSANPRPKFELGSTTFQEYKAAWHEREADRLSLELLKTTMGVELVFTDGNRTGLTFPSRRYT